MERMNFLLSNVSPKLKVVPHTQSYKAGFDACKTLWWEKYSAIE